MDRFRMKANVFSTIPFLLTPVLCHAETIPSMKDVLAIQHKCDLSEFAKLGWAEPPGLGKLATKSWSIVSDLSVEELSSESNRPRTRKFKMKFKGWDIIFCGVDSKTLEDKMKPQDREMVLEISEKSKKDERIVLLEEDTNSDGSLKDQWGQFIFNSIGEGNHGEGGLSCLVEKDLFVRDISVIDINKLCSNESPQRRKVTEEYLKVLQKKLKTYK